MARAADNETMRDRSIANDQAPPVIGGSAGPAAKSTVRRVLSYRNSGLPPVFRPGAATTRLRSGGWLPVACRRNWAGLTWATIWPWPILQRGDLRVRFSGVLKLRTKAAVQVGVVSLYLRWMAVALPPPCRSREYLAGRAPLG